MLTIRIEKVYNSEAMQKPKMQTNFYKLVLEITWLLVIFLVPLFFDPQSYQIFAVSKASSLQFLIMAMLAFWVADWLQNPNSHRRLNWRNIFSSPLHLAILTFGLLAIVSTAASITPAISFWGSWDRQSGLLILICWILFFLIVAQQIRNRAQLFRAVYTLLLSSGVVSIVGILQHLSPDLMLKVLQIPFTMTGRISSTIGNPLFLSSFLAMVIPFNLALIVYSWSKRKEGENTWILIGLVILLALQFWCLWLAQYSITILLYVISLIIFIIIWGIVKRKKLLLGLGAASVIGLVIIAGMLLVPLLLPAPGIVETQRPKDLEPVTLSEYVGLDTLGLRVQFWHSAIDIVLKSPEVPFSNDKLHFLRKAIGYGPETFIVTFQLFFPDKLKSYYTHMSQLVDRPHNDYLYIATTMGLLGLVSFLSILAVFFYLCFRYLRRATADIDKLFLIAMLAGIIQYMADIFFNLSTISPELVFWLILAMVPVIGRFIWNGGPSGAELEGIAQTESSVAPHVTRTRFFLSLGCAVALIIVGAVIVIRPLLSEMYIVRGLNPQAKDRAQAIYAFNRATDLEPGESAYWYYLGAYSYSVARSMTEEPLKEQTLALSTDAYNKALELRPYIAFENYSLADVYTYWAETGAADKWHIALSLYERASQLFPKNAVILNKWSLALIIKGDLDEARTKLDYAASLDPEWAETSFISGLILAREGKNEEAALKITQPITDKPSNLSYFIDLCNDLIAYDMVSPLGDSLEIYTQEKPDDWTAHALLGITILFGGNVDKSLGELNTAMLLVPDNDVADLFRAVLKLTTMSPKFKTALPGVATQWRDKLGRSPDRATLLPALDQLMGGAK